MHSSAAVQGISRCAAGQAAARSPGVRVLLPLVLLLMLATFAPPGLKRAERPPAVTMLSFEPVALDEDRPRRRRLGALLYLGGWAIESADYRFGGVSALHIEGREAVTFSDAGWLTRFTLPQDGRPVRAELGALEEGPGSRDEKSDRDIESIALAGGQAWIAFERVNQVWRYDRRDWSKQAAARPKAMRTWSSNRGAEAMVRLADDRFLIFSEGKGGDSDALLFAGDPAVAGTASVKLRYRPPAGYRITDAALLPDGRLLLLNRRVTLFEGWSAKLTVAEPSLRPGSIIEGREIAVLARPITSDNMEALSVSREDGRTILWIASDDNYSPLQRTLLLKFALVGQGRSRP
jgi:hypothetical protein